MGPPSRAAGVTPDDVAVTSDPAGDGSAGSGSDTRDGSGSDGPGSDGSEAYSTRSERARSTGSDEAAPAHQALNARVRLPAGVRLSPTPNAGADADADADADCTTDADSKSTASGDSLTYVSPDEYMRYVYPRPARGYSGGAKHTSSSSNSPELYFQGDRSYARRSLGGTCLSLSIVAIIVAVIGVVAVAAYLGVQTSDDAKALQYEMHYAGRFRVLRGDFYHPGLDDTESADFQHKADHYQKMLETLFSSSYISEAFRHAAVRGFGNDSLTVFFRIHLDRRKIPRTVLNTEEAVRDVITQEVMSLEPRAFRKLEIDINSIHVTRQRRGDGIWSASATDGGDGSGGGSARGAATQETQLSGDGTASRGTRRQLGASGDTTDTTEVAAGAATDDVPPGADIVPADDGDESGDAYQDRVRPSTADGPAVGPARERPRPASPTFASTDWPTGLDRPGAEYRPDRHPGMTVFDMAAHGLDTDVAAAATGTSHRWLMPDGGPVPQRRGNGPWLRGEVGGRGEIAGQVNRMEIADDPITDDTEPQYDWALAHRIGAQLSVDGRTELPPSSLDLLAAYGSSPVLAPHTEPHGDAIVEPDTPFRPPLELESFISRPVPPKVDPNPWKPMVPEFLQPHNTRTEPVQFSRPQHTQNTQPGRPSPDLRTPLRPSMYIQPPSDQSAAFGRTPAGYAVGPEPIQPRVPASYQHDSPGYSLHVPAPGGHNLPHDSVWSDRPPEASPDAAALEVASHNAADRAGGDVPATQPYSTDMWTLPVDRHDQQTRYPTSSDESMVMPRITELAHLLEEPRHEHLPGSTGNMHPPNRSLPENIEQSSPPDIGTSGDGTHPPTVYPPTTTENPPPTTDAEEVWKLGANGADAITETAATGSAAPTRASDTPTTPQSDLTPHSSLAETEPSSYPLYVVQVRPAMPVPDSLSVQKTLTVLSQQEMDDGLFVTHPSGIISRSASALLEPDPDLDPATSVRRSTRSTSPPTKSPVTASLDQTVYRMEVTTSQVSKLSSTSEFGEDDSESSWLIDPYKMSRDDTELEDPDVRPTPSEDTGLIPDHHQGQSTDVRSEALLINPSVLGGVDRMGIAAFSRPPPVRRTLAPSSPSYATRRVVVVAGAEDAGPDQIGSQPVTTSPAVSSGAFENVTRVTRPFLRPVTSYSGVHRPSRRKPPSQPSPDRPAGPGQAAAQLNHIQRHWPPPAESQPSSGANSGNDSVGSDDDYLYYDTDVFTEKTYVGSIFDMFSTRKPLVLDTDVVTSTSVSESTPESSRPLLASLLRVVTRGQLGQGYGRSDDGVRQLGGTGETIRDEARSDGGPQGLGGGQSELVADKNRTHEERFKPVQEARRPVHANTTGVVHPPSGEVNGPQSHQRVPKSLMLAQPSRPPAGAYPTPTSPAMPDSGRDHRAMVANPAFVLHVPHQLDGGRAVGSLAERLGLAAVPTGRPFQGSRPPLAARRREKLADKLQRFRVGREMVSRGPALRALLGATARPAHRWIGSVRRFKTTRLPNSSPIRVIRYKESGSVADILDRIFERFRQQAAEENEVSLLAGQQEAEVVLGGWSTTTELPAVTDPIQLWPETYDRLYSSEDNPTTTRPQRTERPRRTERLEADTELPEDYEDREETKSPELVVPPTHTTERPTEAEATVAGDRPQVKWRLVTSLMSGIKEWAGGWQPTAERPQPTAERPQPTTERPRPTSNRPKLTTGRPKLTADRPELTADQLMLTTDWLKLTTKPPTLTDLYQLTPVLPHLAADHFQLTAHMPEHLTSFHAHQPTADWPPTTEAPQVAADTDNEVGITGTAPTRPTLASLLRNYTSAECQLGSQFRCTRSGECVPSFTRCNMLLECSDGSDEQDCTCADRLHAQFLERKICDGIVDCHDSSDEQFCEWCRPDQFICPANKKCIDTSAICDGRYDCPDGADEHQCVTLAATRGAAGQPRYQSAGYMMVRKRGRWGPLCVDNFEALVRQTGTTWTVQELGRAVCSALTYRDTQHVFRTESEPPGVRNASEPFYKLVLSDDERRSESENTSLVFEETTCAHHTSVHISCDGLKCGLRPRVKQRPTARIVGGTNASPGAWPWQAAMYRDGEYQCGATLITARWLLSAGHCFLRSTGNHWVARLGAYRRGSSLLSPFESLHVVSHIVVHPQYQDIGYVNDIALLTLEDTVSMSDFVRPVCLPPPGTHVVEGALCTVVGWGQLFESGRIFPDTLQEVQLPLISSRECKKRTAFLPLYRITDDMFCAGLDRGGRDACLGDSGGPLMCQEPSGEWMLTGITSNGYGCARAARPGVYTKVANYIGWIDDVTGGPLPRRRRTHCPGHRCPLGRCLARSSVCDGVIHCADGSDEQHCQSA